MAHRRPRIPPVTDDTPNHVKLLRGIREKFGWSQEELGAALNVSGRTIRHWEHQATAPKSAWLTAFQELLEADIAEENSV